MRLNFSVIYCACFAMLFANATFAAAPVCSGMSTGSDGSLNGYVPFGAVSLWNTDITSWPVDPESAQILNSIGPSVALHPDFGSSPSYGIPYQVVTGAQAKIPVKVVAYPSESDLGPQPIPSNALIEAGSDHHLLVLDKDGCWLYELDRGVKHTSYWQADSAAVWDMTFADQRPYTWTSADAAGLPVFAGLIRYDEATSGPIQHAFRYTVPNTRQAFVLPATHWASSSTDTTLPPMGARLRLKSTFDISGFSPINQAILVAMKKYGIILADNGSALYVTGTSDSRWNDNDLNALKSLHVSDFELVQLGTVYTSGNIPQGALPVISSFTASASTVSAGTPVTLSWTISGAEYALIMPQVGPVRTTSVVVVPSATTTYQFEAVNLYGRSVKSVKVTVQ